MVNEVATDDVEEEEEELEQDQNLIFTVKSQEFGIQAVRVQEISTVLPTTKVPNAPLYIEGIMNLRGRLASVINFRKKLGFELKKHDEDTRIIVVELDTFPIGIIVDSVAEVIKIPAEKVQKLPESTTTSASKDYMTGVGMLDNRLIILLDVDKVLTSAELIELSEINQIMEETEEAPEPAETNQILDEAKEAPEAAKTEQLTDKSEEAPEAAKTEQLTDKAKEVSEAAKTEQMTDKSEEAPEPAETDQMTDKAKEVPEAAKTEQMTDKSEEAPEPAESKNIDVEQPTNKANRRTKRRTG